MFVNISWCFGGFMRTNMEVKKPVWSEKKRFVLNNEMSMVNKELALLMPFYVLCFCYSVAIFNVKVGL